MAPFFFNGTREIPLRNISGHTSHGSAGILIGMLDDTVGSKTAKPHAKIKTCMFGWLKVQNTIAIALSYQNPFYNKLE